MYEEWRDAVLSNKNEAVDNTRFDKLQHVCNKQEAVDNTRMDVNA